MKNLFILILFFLTSVLYCQELEFISPSTDEEVAGIIPVKVKVISQNKNDIPLLQVIEATEEALNPMHPKVDFIEIPDPIIDTQERKGNNFITTYVYKWDTCHVPTPLDESIINSHNGNHTLKLTLGDKSITENVTLNNLTIKVSPDKIFNLVDLNAITLDDLYIIDESDIPATVNIKPQTITVKVEGKNTDKPYNLIINLYHKETPFAGVRNKKGENLNKPIMTYSLENVIGKTQSVVWKGESNFDKEIAENIEKTEAAKKEIFKKYNIDEDKEYFTNEELTQLTDEERKSLGMIERPQDTYNAPEPVQSLIPGIYYNHKSDPVIDWRNFNYEDAEKKAINIDVNQNILGKVTPYGEIISNPGELYAYTDDLSGYKYKFNYNNIDWTDMAQKYDLKNYINYDNGKIYCDLGPYVAQVIITQKDIYNIKINNKNYTWETEDTNRSDSEYLFTELYKYDNGEFEYHLEYPNEETEKEIEKLNRKNIETVEYYQNIQRNIYSELEEIQEEINKCENEEEKQKLIKQKEEKREETEKRLNETAIELVNKLKDLDFYQGHVLTYRLTDLKGNNASEIYNNIVTFYISEYSLYSQEYDIDNENTGYEATPQGVNHKAILIIDGYSNYADIKCIENIAKDSDGMYYRDHENRWSL